MKREKDYEKKRNDKNGVTHSLLRVIYSVMDLDHSMRYYGTDVPLHFGEIHMIKEIKVNPGTYISELAEKNGVTRGAVSQMVKKLEKKGILVKVPDERNRSRLLLELTDKGNTAFEEHERYHRVFNEMLDKALEEFEGVEKERINEFLGKVLEITKYFKIMIKK